MIIYGYLLDYILPDMFIYDRILRIHNMLLLLLDVAKAICDVYPKSIRPAFIYFFSSVRVLCTTNLLQEVRPSTKNITLKF